MALQTSGQISMGDINVELGNSSTALISLNDTAVRDLAGIPSGQISLSDFYGASAVPPIFLVGSVSADRGEGEDIRVDFSSIGAQPGDLLLVACSYDSDFPDIGFSTSPALSLLGTTYIQGPHPGGFVGQRFLQAGDSTEFRFPNMSGGAMRDFTIVISAFRGITTRENFTSASGFGSPNPPSLTANGSLWIATAHLSNDVVAAWVAPSGYTLAGTSVHGSPGIASSTAVAYKVASLSSDNPGIFAGDGDDTYFSYTIAYS